MTRAGLAIFSETHSSHERKRLCARGMRRTHFLRFFSTLIYVITY